jgi:pyruvate,water dikinase
MGTSLFGHLLKVVGRVLFWRDLSEDINKSLPWISDGKLFFNLSSGFALAGKKKVVELLPIIDPLGAKAIEQLDEREYVFPAWKFQLLPYGLLWRLPGLLLFIRRARHDPLRLHQQVQESLRRFEADVKRISEKTVSLIQIWEELLYEMFRQVFLLTVPLTVASRYALGRLQKAAGNGPEVARLMKALPNNVTTEMGLELGRVAELLPEGLDAAHAAKNIRERTLPEEFMQAWDDFLEKYGYRGASEIDVAALRYYDDPKLIIDLLLSLKNSGVENPRPTFKRNARERQEAYELLHRKILVQDARKADAFAKDYHLFETFGGYRETHKKYLVLVVAIKRRKILALADKLVEAGRLDSVNQVFDLTIEQLETGEQDSSVDLRMLARVNTVFLRRLARVKKPPTVIDSRGFIPRPPASPARDGEHVGVGVSAGVVRGKIKVLHAPDEKPLLKGEILVARATDPGWTPLFVNAGGIILEVGGSLQHGALVAREYGIPCVAGVENATQLWNDGTLVEVDGTSGIIRNIEK